ncbi:Oidioi.mRNA.OKI2018_I69.chr2.g7425.t1.cds [Oikopleura dioica]|uniref:Oidioi.mRNA.OKI2018_I69.chr2.g7425.t1.cds n=1 Tax=Oikopleura dioica TaxID=34765 RepID=A0ABN7TC45_OIKDI|nr:Oidioi.mRNA.OKI2018_I69.chr2.g7425.t1.cds [Oikopleura dioica]
MKLYGALIAFAAAQYDTYSMFDPSTSEEISAERSRRSGDHACSATLKEPLEFVRCRDDHANPEDTHEPNVCMVEERRNNGRTQLNIRCQEKQACKRDVEQNKGQCKVPGAKDRNGIEKASTCRKCHAYGKMALRTIQQGKRNDLRYSRWFQ